MQLSASVAGPDSYMGPGPGPDGRPDHRPGSAASGGMQGPGPGGAAAVPDLPGVNRPAKKQERGNDYCQHFVDTGVRPQNFLRDSVLEDRYELSDLCCFLPTPGPALTLADPLQTYSVLEDRYEDYPQLQKLIQLKDKQVRDHSTPPYALRADLKKLALSKEVFGTKFDVIVIDPPWEEYVRRAPGFVSDTDFWSWHEIQALDIGAVAEVPSFVFLWCGSAEGLDAGRHCLRKWGYKRCEDICWIKTNQQHKSRKYLIPTYQQEGSMLVHTKEHCLMGIRGNVKRGPDGHLIHSNVDTDVIVSEEPPLGSTEKPEELYSIIERFCAGRRRLELFGEDRNIREGWVTVGRSITQSTFRPQAYLNHFRNEDGVPYDEHRGRPPPGVPVLVPSTAEIEELRPRSPPHHAIAGRGRGR
ncbi:MT-A70-domain-containing protein [Scenedesmus sp. NREL 46B-D3]|nr:MT-A70-domain-containing protein [Scenedesmus sp. NREL 46B-D3]